MTLYSKLLPLLQAVNAEGGGFATFQFSRPVLDLIDSGAAGDESLARIRRKIVDTIDAVDGKRDHTRFSKVFEAYSEGVVYLVAQARSVHLNTLVDGKKTGVKTPDFATRGAPTVGLEVKTIDVFSPAETYDAAMDRNFEASYAAEEEARANAAASPSGQGVGTAITEFAPHGEGSEIRDAIVQTTRKIRNNVKSGQYKAYPTFLVVSLVRLGVHDRAVDLRRRLDLDTNWDERPSGHLFAIAAAQLQDRFFDFSHRRPGITDVGDLEGVGVLVDHPEIAGIVFLHTIWSESSRPDVIETGFRFHGIWNLAWEADAPFAPAEKAEAKRVFEQLCDAWNDTSDSRAGEIPDLGALQDAFRYRVGEFMHTWRGKTPDDDALGAFMVAADREWFLWQAAEAGLPDPISLYTPADPNGIATGILRTGEPVIFLPDPPAHQKVHRLQLAKHKGRWSENRSPDPIRAAGVVI